MRTPTHKLIVYESKDRPDEMYDVKNDPMESKNLANDESAKDIKADLRKRLEDWMRRTNDPALSWKKN